MGDPVIVTRPARQSAALAATLRGRGLDVFEMPLQDIVPLADATALRRAWSDVQQYRLVIFVSPNAIDCALAHWQGVWPASVGIAVMGPGSRQVLAEHGLTDSSTTIICADDTGAATPQVFDSERLLAVLDLQALKERRVLIVKGNGGRAWLAERLTEHGAQVDLVEAYERRPAALAPGARAQLTRWVAGACAVRIVVTNSEALELLLHQVESLTTPPAADWLRAQRLFVGHPRIAQNATALGFTRVEIVALGDPLWVEALE